MPEMFGLKNPVPTIEMLVPRKNRSLGASLTSKPPAIVKLPATIRMPPHAIDLRNPRILSAKNPPTNVIV
jgi:hypothetical protein